MTPRDFVRAFVNGFWGMVEKVPGRRGEVLVDRLTAAIEARDAEHAAEVARLRVEVERLRGLAEASDAGKACSNYPHARCMEEPFRRLCWRHRARTVSCGTDWKVGSVPSLKYIGDGHQFCSAACLRAGRALCGAALAESPGTKEG